MGLSDMMHLALAELERVAVMLAADPAGRRLAVRIRASAGVIEAVRIIIDHNAAPAPPPASHIAPVVDLGSFRARRATQTPDIGGTG